MRKKGHSFALWMALGVVVTAVLYLVFVQSSYFSVFKEWSAGNRALLVVILVAIKITGVVWPPIPGGLISLGAIPIIGWLPAYAADFAGSVCGSIIAYHLGRKYGYPFLRKILDDSIVEKIKKIKIKKEREFEGIFFMRLVGGSIIEVIVYAAGLMRVNFKSFVAATILSHLVIGVPSFYLTNKILIGANSAISVVSLILLALIFFKFRNRYFEW